MNKGQVHEITARQSRSWGMGKQGREFTIPTRSRDNANKVV